MDELAVYEELDSDDEAELPPVAAVPAVTAAEEETADVMASDDEKNENGVEAPDSDEKFKI